jgi:hypothetical protein
MGVDGWSGALVEGEGVIDGGGSLKVQVDVVIELDVECDISCCIEWWQMVSVASVF